MRKTIYFVLITLVLCVTTHVQAVNPTDDPHLFCDFESPTILPASQFHAPDGGGMVSVVANPYKTGLNTSNTVLKIVSPAGANWGGAIFNEISKGETFMNALYGVESVTGYDVVSFLMYREANTNVPQLKTVDIDDDGHTDFAYLDLTPLAIDGDRNYTANGTIKTGQWQKVEYSVTHCHNSGIKFIYIMPDRLGSSTVYIDDIIFGQDKEKPVMGSATCGTSTAGSISLYVTATDNLSNPVNHYMVSMDGTLANAQDVKATNGVLTIFGLDANTTYTFTIWAKDYAGNVSDNYTTVTCATTNAASGNYCRKPVTAAGHTIYISCEKTAANTYVLTIESDEIMTGLGGSHCHVNGNQAYQMNINGRYVLSPDGKKITCTIISTTDPDFYTPLYVLMPGEVVFQQPVGVIWGVCTVEEPPVVEPPVVEPPVVEPTVINHPQIEICIGDSIGLKGAENGPWMWNTGDTAQMILILGMVERTETYTCTTDLQIDNYIVNVVDCTPPAEPCTDLIYRKWNDVLFVDNGDSLFVAYQWYRDGQALEGETKQYYYTAGQSMQGDGHEYHAVAFRADGTEVHSCAYAFEAFTRSADLNPENEQNIQLYPNPVCRNMPVHVVGAGEEEPLLILYNAMGHKIAQYKGVEFVVNLPAGCYILQVLDTKNQPICRTLIVE